VESTGYLHRALLLAALAIAGCAGPDTTPLVFEQFPPTGQPDDPGGAPPPTTPPPSVPPPSSDPLAGGVLATFRHTGIGVDGQPFDETWHVWVTNAQAIDDLYALQAGTSTRAIPGGQILAGPGVANHNAPWSWHLAPDSIQMADVAAEVCDGRPSIVESLLADYLALGQFCPWSAQLAGLEDHR